MKPATKIKIKNKKLKVKIQKPLKDKLWKVAPNLIQISKLKKNKLNINHSRAVGV